MVVLGFMGASEIGGVTSFCRFWGVGESGYLRLLHLFRSSAFSLEGLIACWGAFVLSQGECLYCDGRVVLLGDHTEVPKDGGRMPGVATLHQNSETQSKPSFFRGHFWGSIGAVIGRGQSFFCIPLNLNIQQGRAHIHEDEESGKDQKKLGTNIVQMAIEFAFNNAQPCVLVLDAFFPSAAVFMLASSWWSIEHQAPFVTLIIRAKKNCVACFEAEKPSSPKAGRPRKYGEKVKLMELFDHKDSFEKVTCTIYGQVEEVFIRCDNLLWKPTGELIRFVLAETSRGPIILMCSDLAQNPIAALELYCKRIRIETMFDMLKNRIGAFHYRFWTKALPRHSRKPVKNSKLKKPSEDMLESVVCCWDAYERFVMTGAIAPGLLQVIALKFTDRVWGQFDAYIRTRSNEIPSERTVKTVIANLLVKDLHSFTPLVIMRLIRSVISEMVSPRK